MIVKGCEGEYDLRLRMIYLINLIVLLTKSYVQFYEE